jgi:hypothetical protein
LFSPIITSNCFNHILFDRLTSFKYCNIHFLFIYYSCFTHFSPKFISYKLFTLDIFIHIIVITNILPTLQNDETLFLRRLLHLDLQFYLYTEEYRRNNHTILYGLAIFLFLSFLEKRQYSQKKDVDVWVYYFNLFIFRIL